MTLRTSRLMGGVAGLLVFLGTMASAQGLDVSTLQRMLQAKQQTVYLFDEQRESPWLAAPVRAHGRLQRSGGVLEKIVESPHPETWRLLPDRLQVVRAGAEEPAEIRFSAAPALGELANALRLALTGELAELARDFDLTLSGSVSRWTLRVVPRGSQARQAVQELELQGSGALMGALLVVDGQGERTLMQLEPLP